MSQKKKTSVTTNKGAVGTFWIIYFSGLAITLLLFFAIGAGWLGKMPSFEELENPQTNLASEIISSDGVLLGTFFVENRSNVQFRELSPHMVNAILAIEDVRFTEHSGIDVKALFRVAWGIITGNSKGGGSTLSQQLAKNLFPRDENLNFLQLVLRKFMEWITASKLERSYSKEEILAMYLNTVPFGSNAFGIKSAAMTFFGKSPDSLNIEEAALMAGVVNAPTRFSPVRNPERALQRRNLVLNKMREYGFITQAEYDAAVNNPIDMSNFGMMDHNTGIATYFREYLRAEMRKWTATHYKSNGKNYDIYKDGLKIYTTIDSRMQRHAEEAMREHLANDLQPAFFKHWRGQPNAPFDFPPSEARQEIEKIMQTAMRRTDRYRFLKQAGVSNDSIIKNFNTPTRMRVFAWNGYRDTIMTPMDSIRYYKSYLQSSLMSVDVKTGQVRAYVGGIDYRHFKFDNATQARRQVGSTFKPFVYTLAMQEGEYTPCYKVPNIPYSVQLWDGTFWEPKNSNNDRLGEEVTLKWALANSNNWISAYLIKRFPPESVIQMARKMGVVSPIDPVPAIALGTPEITLYEMVGAMNTFANKGVYIKPYFITRIEDKNGNIIERFAPEQSEALDEITAYKMVALMKGVVESGTGMRLRGRYNLRNPIAGKTGTTQNQSDGWFMGLTPDLVTGVWTGAEDRSVHFRSLQLGQGANTALPIWALYMIKLYNDPSIRISKGDFERPSGYQAIEFNCEMEDTQRNIRQWSNPDEF
jgi:penicillin-binding protein 1A